MTSDNKISDEASDGLFSALAQLRLKLLDLTGRNRLINFKPSIGKSLQFVEGQDNAVYEKLVESNSKSSINLIGLPEPTQMDWEEKNGRIQKPDPREWAKKLGIPTTFEIEPSGKDDTNLRALLYEEDLAKHCRKIEREANLAIEETGSNMLFLVLGFLEFPDQRVSDKSFSAPLISIPVSLQKREVAGIQQFSLQYTGDDISENLSLFEKLRNDYGITLPKLSEEQIDLEKYFSEIQEVIKSQPGFLIRRRTTLCLLSFSNMLLVRDLDPSNWPSVNESNGLTDHPIIRSIFQGIQDTGESGLDISEEHPVEEHPGSSIPLVYDADSSQHSALIDVISFNKNLVIQGPPGTGKSQTITNLIAASIARGKKVLFVAEKLAALQVVKNRLSLAGLDPFVLELHSNKANKKKVLEEIGERLDHKPSASDDIPRLMMQIEAHRSSLKTYTDLINSVSNNLLGLTLHQVMWRAEKHRAKLITSEAILTQISIDNASQLSEMEFGRRVDCLSYLSAQYDEIGGFDKESVFWGFFPDHLVPGDEVFLKNLYQEWMLHAKDLNATAIEIQGILDEPNFCIPADMWATEINELEKLIKKVKPETPINLIPGFFDNDAKGVIAREHIKTLERKIQEYKSAQESMNVGLKTERSIDPSFLINLFNFIKEANKYGFVLGCAEDLSNATSQIESAVLGVKENELKIREFALQKNLPYSGSKENIKKLSRLTRLILAAPIEDLGIQSPQLAKEGASQSIEKLNRIQNELIQFESDLDKRIYLDTIPSDIEIKEAIATFREGDTWYRIFQARWRKAKNLHTRLQRNKVKLPIITRLKDLEHLMLLNSIKSKWSSDLAWDKYLGIPVPPTPIPLDKYISLATWNQEVKLALEELQVSVIDPSSFTPEQARTLRREYTEVNTNISSVISNMKLIVEKFSQISEDEKNDSVTKIAERAGEFAKNINHVHSWLLENAKKNVAIEQVYKSYEAAILRDRVANEINSSNDVKALLKEHFAGVNTNCALAFDALDLGLSIDELQVSDVIKRKIKKNNLLEFSELIKQKLIKISIGLERISEFTNTVSKYGEFNFWLSVGVDWRNDKNISQSSSDLKDEIEEIQYQIKQLSLRGDFDKVAELQHGKLPLLEKRLRELTSNNTFESSSLNNINANDANKRLSRVTDALYSYFELAYEKADELIPWSLYVSRRKEALDLGLTTFVNFLEEKQFKFSELTDSYAYCVHSTIIREAFRRIPELGRFSGLKHSQIREEFKRLDREIISLRGVSIAIESVRKAKPPYGQNGARVDDRTEMVLLRYLLPQQRPRMPVRKILTRAGASIQELKPCFMMGPQAVAQYLAPGSLKFDLVIMDEASQLKPEEAIGAIARGGQLVVVGDPKQLPPTSFFSKMSQAGDDEEQFSTTDAESILDVCSSHFHPPRSLRWHYRSQHHSLIAFSNHNFYGGNLVIFPSPYGQSGKLGVRAVYLADAVYENQTNMREAKRVVDAVVEHIATRPDDSLGIVTLNIKQRDLISELIEERLRSFSGADEFKEKWAIAGQPIFVKNLENVQGDERDAIIISTTFGKPPGASAVRQNFGPISRQGGWRRLNVLFTRAKKSVTVYTSLRPEDIVADSSTPEGTRALRNYLEYARSGTLTVATQTDLDPDSDFEVSVIDMLKSRGYEVTPQLGVAGYRIDIAVKHPNAPGSYLAAIECDGATYHSALSVRDRDRIRQEILESLGWRGRIWRIWSTDWFRTPRQESEKLLKFLEDLIVSWLPEHAAGSSWIEEIDTSVGVLSGSQEANTKSSQTSLTKGAFDLEDASSVLIADEQDFEIEVGDVVRYVDKLKPADVLTVQITNGKDDFDNGIVNESRPLAQILLGAVVGDEVTLHLPGTAARNFQILGISKKYNSES